MALQRILRPMLSPEALQNDAIPQEHSETETASV
jgi:hypothetical protein